MSFLFAPVLRKRNYWVLLERGNDAQDNAWHLFRYLVDKQPDVNAVYAIRKTSPDYQSNLAGYEGRTIEYGSLWYYLVLYNCRVLLSTHAHTYLPHLWSNVKGGIWDIMGKKIHLHHGVVHRNNSVYMFPNLDVDLNLCGAVNEYILFKTVFKYPDSHLNYTGMARFDNLHDCQTKRQVLIMPTWRAKYVNYTKEQFKNTDFFKSYKYILSNHSLVSTLEKNDYELVFYNHYEFQKYNELFEPFCKGRVHLRSFGEQKVQELLKESRLLVTDYSSIYYDFLYMRKPIVFFLLHQADFNSSQYGERFDDPKMFGDVAEQVEDTVSFIVKHVNNDCTIEDQYLAYADEIFPLYDKLNCERIYRSVSDLSIKQKANNKQNNKVRK